MKDFDVDKLTIRCSQLGKILIDPKKSEPISDTTKSYLLSVFANEYFGRRKDIGSKYNKGIYFMLIQVFLIIQDQTVHQYKSEK